jgi:hypothetical protein
LAVPAGVGVSNSVSDAIFQGVSFVEVGAVLNLREIWILGSLLFSGGFLSSLTKRLVLSQTPFWVAVVSGLWIWDGASHSVVERESLVEVWAVLD